MQEIGGALDEESIQRVSTGHLLSYLDTAWNCVRFNEEQRNKFFNFYIVISGAFVVFVDQNVAQDSEIAAEKIGLGMASSDMALFAAILVNVVGALFLSIFLRARTVILRDLSVIKLINATLASRDEECGVFESIHGYYEKRETSNLFKLIDNTFLISVTVAIISTGIIAFSVSIKFPLLWAAVSGAVCAVLHAVVIFAFYFAHNSAFKENQSE